MNPDDVIDAIRTGKAKMHSRSYFILMGVLTLICAILLFSIIFFVLTFIIFALQENGGLFAVGFGPSGWLIFLGSLPWSLLLLSIALILILWILLRRYSVVYHQPFLYTLLMLIVVISIAGFFLSAGAIHGSIDRYVLRNQIPVVTNVYEFETSPMNGIYRGQAVMIATSSLILADTIGQTSTVLLIPVAAAELARIRPGDYVIVFGRPVATATIQASGVEAITYYQ
jgi:hypothetical protein